jgi:hypothetical protein
MTLNYILKALLAFVFVTFLGQKINAQQFKLLVVDPTADTVTIKNFGTTTQNVGNYRLCSLFSYLTISSQTTVISGSLNLAPNAEVTVSSSGFLNDSEADLGLYLPSGSFGSAANMVDFTQWGSAGNGRESVAVSAGLWTAGTFINLAPPYEFNGGAGDSGVNFWSTSLSVNNLDSRSRFTIFPNPSNSIMTIDLNTSPSNLTFEVFNILGKQIHTQHLENTNTTQVDVSNWNNGLYLIKISNGNKIETIRFIKQ